MFKRMWRIGGLGVSMILLVAASGCTPLLGERPNEQRLHSQGTAIALMLSSDTKAQELMQKLKERGFSPDFKEAETRVIASRLRYIGIPFEPSAYLYTLQDELGTILRAEAFITQKVGDRLRISILQPGQVRQANEEEIQAFIQKLRQSPLFSRWEQRRKDYKPVLMLVNNSTNKATIYFTERKAERKGTTPSRATPLEELEKPYFESEGGGGGPNAVVYYCVNGWLCQEDRYIIVRTPTYVKVMIVIRCIRYKGC